MIWQRFNCALGRHTYVTDAGHEIEGIAAPATCACGVRRRAIVWPRTSEPAAPTIPPIERAQVISAKPGDTIVIMSDALMSAHEKMMTSAIIASKLPEGVKVLMLDRGMKVAHIEAGAAKG